jgi:hypothetical protein
LFLFNSYGYFIQTTLICDSDGQCKIDMNNRHICTSCRLAKCFNCGMTTDKFRASREIKPKTNTLVKVQMQRRPQQVRLGANYFYEIKT